MDKNTMGSENSDGDVVNDEQPAEEEEAQEVRGQPEEELDVPVLVEILPQRHGTKAGKPGHKKPKSAKTKVETDPLLMSLPELTKFLQGKASKRKTKLAQRQRAALLGFLPPGMLPPPKVLGKQVPALESAVEMKDHGTKSQPLAKPVVPKIPKLRRKSLLDHMERKMEMFGHQTILFRMVIVGSHEENPNDLLVDQGKRIKELNIAPEVELLTGLLLIYPKHFLHVLEGSEMVLCNYIEDAAYEFEKKSTLLNLEPDDKVQHVKMVIVCMIQVDQRLAKHWYSTVTTYPTHNNLMEIGGYQNRLFDFVKMAWTLAIVAKDFISLLPSIKDSSDEDTVGAVQETDKELTPALPAGTAEDDDGEVDQQSELGNNDYEDAVHELMEESLNLLPSVDILQYFLKDKQRCPKLLTPQQHINTYWGLSNDPSWRDVAWPVPSRIYPYD